MSPPELLNPVVAYDRIAAVYSQIRERRQAYLSAIENLTATRIPTGSTSMLDVGAADGVRSFRIAAQAGVKAIVLLEPSREMIQRMKQTAEICQIPAPEIWQFRAQDLSKPDLPQQDVSPQDLAHQARRFDVITCLWNVLGHIPTSADRVRVMTQLGRMLTSAGRIFVDVNHRYNSRSYGLIKTGARFLKDRISPSSTNGDVKVTWGAGNGICQTYGHVFTSQEIRSLASAANLTIDERIVVDYETGRTARSLWQGNLFYVLRRNSSTHSTSALTTS